MGAKFSQTSKADWVARKDEIREGRDARDNSRTDEDAKEFHEIRVELEDDWKQNKCDSDRLLKEHTAKTRKADEEVATVLMSTEDQRAGAAKRPSQIFLIMHQGRASDHRSVEERKVTLRQITEPNNLTPCCSCDSVGSFLFVSCCTHHAS